MAYAGYGMAFLELLKLLADRKVRLQVEGDRLKCRSASSLVTNRDCYNSSLSPITPATTRLKPPSGPHWQVSSHSAHTAALDSPLHSPTPGHHRQMTTDPPSPHTIAHQWLKLMPLIDQNAQPPDAITPSPNNEISLYWLQHGLLIEATINHSPLVEWTVYSPPNSFHHFQSLPNVALLTSETETSSPSSEPPSWQQKI